MRNYITVIIINCHVRIKFYLIINLKIITNTNKLKTPINITDIYIIIYIIIYT